MSKTKIAFVLTSLTSILVCVIALANTHRSTEAGAVFVAFLIGLWIAEYPYLLAGLAATMVVITAMLAYLF